MIKKVYLIPIVILSVGIIIAINGITLAKISGRPCYECHSMHEPGNYFLTVKDCLGCHGKDGENGLVANAPNIFGDPTSNPSTMRAGGTFNDAPGLADAKDKRHDVIDIWFNGDDTSDYITPGNEGSPIQIGPKMLTCAGDTGCHGDHSKTGSILGIYRFHHSDSVDAHPNDNTTDPDAYRSKNGYRYCQKVDGTEIESWGSTDWEKGGAKGTNHNVYKAGENSINEFCAQCHGKFHGTTNTNETSPFKRHPVDNLLSDAIGWKMDDINISEEDIPFCFKDISTMKTNNAYVTANARVSCISCHRAHGSPYNNILRWDYNSQKAGKGNDSSTGCLGCHSDLR